MAEDGVVYKLVGPVLLKQDKTEAVMAVDGRLEFIENETYTLQFHRRHSTAYRRTESGLRNKFRIFNPRVMD